MKDEIKEILGNIREIIKLNRENDFNRIIYDCDSMEKLLDYITNLQCDIDGYKTKYKNAKENLKKLQEENKEWSMIFDTFSKRPYAHKYLEEKRKELNNDKIVGLDSEMIYKDYYDYKSRNEKAREFIIEKCITSDMWEEQKFNKFIPIGYIKYKPLSSKNTEKLYNILGGDDNEIN